MDDPSYKNTKAALGVIFDRDFIKHLNKALRKFEQENPCATDIATAAYILAKEIYDKNSTFQVLYVFNEHPARNLRSLLAQKLGLN